MDEFIKSIVEAIPTILVIGICILGYEHIRLWVTTIYKYIKSEAEKKKKDDSSQ